MQTKLCYRINILSLSLKPLCHKNHLFILLKQPFCNVPPTNTNIKSNAWKFDVSITNGSNVNKISNVEGKAVLVAGKRTFYYFLIDSVDQTWKNNQKVWQQVLDSIKVDQ